MTSPVLTGTAAQRGQTASVPKGSQGGDRDDTEQRDKHELSWAQRWLRSSWALQGYD